MTKVTDRMLNSYDFITAASQKY